MEPIKEKSDKKKNTALAITGFFIMLCLLCLLIDYSPDRSIDWALYPIGGLGVCWATLIPWLVAKKHPGTWSFAALALTLVPFVYLIEYLAPLQGWFMPLALPIILLCLSALGLSLIALTRKNLNKFYAFAIAIFMYGVVVNMGVGLIVYRFLNEGNPYDDTRIWTLSAATTLSLVLLIIGYSKRKAS